MSLFDREIELIGAAPAFEVAGRVADLTGLTIAVNDFPAAIGSICRIDRRSGGEVPAQVVGIRERQAILMPLAEPLGVSRGDRVVCLAAQARVSVSEELLGRVVNGLGAVIDGGPRVDAEDWYPLYRTAPDALSRPRISEPLGTGIRAMDAMLTAGRGQRLGLFAGTGVGKSVLLGMISRYTAADVTVMALVGERGREVNDYLEKDLGPEGRKKTILVISTSDESPVLRVRAGFVATAIAEFFRDRGKDVLLLMDSVTRLAMAQRQIGLAVGEPPAAKGYTPSVFAILPQLLERAGRTAHGSVTGFYTVLVEADDMNEPISDAVRGILDGHVWLSRSLANKGHYPAIGVLDSISRVMVDVVSEQHQAAARRVQRILAVWQDIEDLVNIGAYAAGTNPQFDLAVQAKPLIDAFLQQRVAESVTFEDAQRQLLLLAQQLEQIEHRLGKAGREPASERPGLSRPGRPRG
jgi:flagellum-specific ATP synthase